MSTANRSLLPNGAWRIVFLLFFVGCLNYLDRTMMATIRSSIMQAIPMSNAQFGLLSSAFLLSYGLVSPFTGYLSDRFDRSRVITISLIAWSILIFLTGYCRSVEQLVAARLLLGIAEACYVPAAMALITDYHQGSTRPLATGIQVSSFLVGQSLGFLPGMIVGSYSWSVPFFIFGSVGVAYGLVLIFFLRDRVDHDTPGKGLFKPEISFSAALKHLFTKSSYWLLLALWSILYLVGWLVIVWVPAFYQERFNLSQAVSGLYATAYIYPASILGVIFGGYLTSKWGRSNPAATIYVPLIGLCIAVPCILIATTSVNLTLTITLFLIYGFTRIFSDGNIMPILCLVTDPRYRATGFGFLNLFASLMGGLGLYLTGMLRDLHMEMASIFKIVAGVLGLCLFILFFIHRQIGYSTEKVQ